MYIGLSYVWRLLKRHEDVFWCLLYSVAKWIKQARASRPNIVRATFHYTDPCKWILFNPRHALPPEFSRITRVLFNKGFSARFHPQNHISHRLHYIGMYENASKPFSKNRSYISIARFACHSLPLGLRPRSSPDKCDLEFTVLRPQNDADKPLFQ